MSEPVDITNILLEWSSGNEQALEKLLPLVYDHLYRLAQSYLQKEHLIYNRSANTLQPTALINEAYLRLVDQKKVSWQNRAHFFAVAATLMRRILVDHARNIRAEKRGKGEKVPLETVIDLYSQQQVDIDVILLVHNALDQLAALDPRQARIVEQKFFAGLTVEEIAEIEKIAPITVKREWAVAKAWLYAQLQEELPKSE